MVYKFDPIYWNGTIFEFDDWDPLCDLGDYIFRNEPVPAACFPKALSVIGARQALPDIFHTYRDIIIFSEKARLVIEERAPGQVAFIPVALNASPKIATRLRLASAYYFINVLGRAQRLKWLEMPVKEFRPKKDGTEVTTMTPDLKRWEIRERAEGEPLIWHDAPWSVGNKRYNGQAHVFIEDDLWGELDANFPDQLNALRVGSQ